MCSDILSLPCLSVSIPTLPGCHNIDFDVPSIPKRLLELPAVDPVGSA